MAHGTCESTNKRNHRHNTVNRLPFIIATAIAASCTTSPTTRPDDTSRFTAEAVARACRDAQKAIAAPEGSMARENAILAIHARKHRLDQTGDSATARLYLDTAISRLDSAGIFTPEDTI